MRLVAKADILLEGFRLGARNDSASALTTALSANRVASLSAFGDDFPPELLTRSNEAELQF